MSTKTFWIQALLFAAGSLFVAQEISAPAADAAMKEVVAPSIGVVDLAKAYETYPKAIKMRQKLQELKVALREEIVKIDAGIKETFENIKSVGEDSEEGKERMLQYDGLRQLREGRRKRMEEKVGIAEMRMYLELYEDMDVAVAKVAKNRGVQLVLRTYDPGPPPPFSDNATNVELVQMQERLRMFERRPVLYNSDEIDLTDDLRKLLQVPLEKDITAPAK